jgi:hypothetical protein
MESVRLGGDTYDVGESEPGGYARADLWQAGDAHGRWTFTDAGIVGEWIDGSPSLFLKQELVGDVLLTMRIRRMRPDPACRERILATKWGPRLDLDHHYNVNFWLRARAPDDGDFLAQYPQRLGTGANGMGDESWRSYFSTIVRGPDGEWMRLRRSPGYEKRCDVQGVLPEFAYDRPYDIAFVIRHGRVRAYVDGVRTYDHLDTEPYERGRIGLCVWLCVFRFEDLHIHRFE